MMGLVTSSNEDEYKRTKSENIVFEIANARNKESYFKMNTALIKKPE